MRLNTSDKHVIDNCHKVLYFYYYIKNIITVQDIDVCNKHTAIG